MATYIDLKSTYPRLLKFHYHHDNYYSDRLCIINNEADFDLACYNFFHDAIYGFKYIIKKEDEYFNNVLKEGKPNLTKKQLLKIAPSYVLYTIEEAIKHYENAKNYKTRKSYILLNQALELDKKGLYSGCGEDIVKLVLEMNNSSFVIEQLITSEHILLKKPHNAK